MSLLGTLSRFAPRAWVDSTRGLFRISSPRFHNTDAHAHADHAHADHAHAECTHAECAHAEQNKAGAKNSTLTASSTSTTTSTTTDRKVVLASHYSRILTALGEDIHREGLLKTPDRAAKAMLEFTHGYEVDPRRILAQALFHEETHGQLVMLRDIEFFSLCEHHLVPFVGKATILYQPQGKIVGLSKLARITDVFARRLQVQERMTKEIAECLQEVLDPKGVAVKLEATHFCMAMRGVRKSGVTTTTTYMTGVFRTDTEARKEVISQMNQNSS
eukprot:TRINITY_DN1409_c0_g2_i1.p1 TRINITY_DN1409_c0_g2~~TRINITY_DN1409_c0_g2_i1.p1  ORF type:complete len:274 (-),score=56.69 TRINITY_DN1409_c0_g2_i1:838-1659(-)